MFTSSLSQKEIAAQLGVAFESGDVASIALFTKLFAEARKPRLLWVVANNVKTGPVLTAYVYPMRAAWKSCDGCSLRGNGCYSWGRRAEMRLAVMERLLAAGAKSFEDYSLARLLKTIRGRRATAVRLTAIGDALSLPQIRAEVEDAVELARAHSKAVLGYTHFAENLATSTVRDDFMVSCDTLLSADAVLDAGGRPAVVVGPNVPRISGAAVLTPEKKKLLVCPYYTKGLTCSACRLCDRWNPVWTKGKIDGIAFPQH